MDLGDLIKAAEPLVSQDLGYHILLGWQLGFEVYKGTFP